MKRISALALVFSFGILSLLSCTCTADEGDADAHITYLFVGYDDAYRNTDCLILADFAKNTEKLTLVQIPRDTYLRSGIYQNKINQLFPAFLARKKDTAKALTRLTAVFSDVFGVPIDGYVAVGLSDASKIVDALGGVSVHLDAPVTVTAGGEEYTLTEGENLLDGKTAAALVRHRKSYSSGDVGRMNAQKIFLQGLIDTLKNRVGLSSALAVSSTLFDGEKTSLSFAEAALLALRYGASLKNAEIAFYTLPGAPALSPGGLSYYIADRQAAGALFKEVFGTSNFDPCALFDGAPIASENAAPLPSGKDTDG